MCGEQVDLVSYYQQRLFVPNLLVFPGPLDIRLYFFVCVTDSLDQQFYKFLGAFNALERRIVHHGSQKPKVWSPVKLTLPDHALKVLSVGKKNRLFLLPDFRTKAPVGVCNRASRMYPQQAGFHYVQEWTQSSIQHFGRKTAKV